MSLIAIALILKLALAQNIAVTAYDATFVKGCDSGADVLYSTNYAVGTCYKGSPSVVNDYYFDAETCPSTARDGSFQITSIDGLTSPAKEGAVILRRFTDDSCATPSSPSVSTSETISVRNGCGSSTLNFMYPIKFEVTEDGSSAPKVNTAPKVIQVAKCDGGSVTSGTVSETTLPDIVNPTESASTVNPTSPSVSNAKGVIASLPIALIMSAVALM